VKEFFIKEFAVIASKNVCLHIAKPLHIKLPAVTVFGKILLKKQTAIDFLAIKN